MKARQWKFYLVSSSHGSLREGRKVEKTHKHYTRPLCNKGVVILFNFY